MHLEVFEDTRDPSGQLLAIVAFDSELKQRQNCVSGPQTKTFALRLSELIEALRFGDLAITCGMNVFSNCIENQFAQFTQFTSISGDENEITLGFKQRSNVRDVAVNLEYACLRRSESTSRSHILQPS